MTIKTIQKISPSKLRSLCIKKDWYTCGTQEEYDNMIYTLINKEPISSEDIYNTAIDIIEHSDLESHAESCGMTIENNEYIESIMFELGQLINTFYEIEN